MSDTTTAFKSPLHEMTQTTATCLWNDSCSPQELGYAIDHGGVGATCNPVIVVDVLKREMHLWKDRIKELIQTLPTRRTDATVGSLSRRIRASTATRPRFSVRPITSPVSRRTSS